MRIKKKKYVTPLGLQLIIPNKMKSADHQGHLIKNKGKKKEISLIKIK